MAIERCNLFGSAANKKKVSKKPRSMWGAPVKFGDRKKNSLSGPKTVCSIINFWRKRSYKPVLLSILRRHACDSSIFVNFPNTSFGLHLQFFSKFRNYLTDFLEGWHVHEVLRLGLHECQVSLINQSSSYKDHKRIIVTYSTFLNRWCLWHLHRFLPRNPFLLWGYNREHVFRGSRFIVPYWQHIWKTWLGF